MLIELHLCSPYIYWSHETFEVSSFYTDTMPESLWKICIYCLANTTKLSHVQPSCCYMSSGK
jgi:hypothetical protein